MINPTSIVTAPIGTHAREALAAAITGAKAGDPMAPVTVVVPSNYSGLSLRRELGWETGLVNVGFMVAPRVAELIAAGRLPSGNTPLTPALRSEAIHAALERDPGPFEHIAGHPATVRALDVTFQDLRDVPEPQLDRLADASPRAEHLVSLYRDFSSHVEGYYDREDLFRVAAGAIEASPAVLRDVGHVILHLPREQTAAELTLWRALGARNALTVVAGVTGDQALDAELPALAESLTGARPTVDDGTPAMPTRAILSAADPDEEVRNALRLIGRELDAGDGARLHRIAVLYPSSGPYSAICSELFAAAGIPFNGPGDRRLEHSVAGQALKALLGFAATDLDRDSVIDFLSLPVELPGRYDVPAARWDYLSREAGVTRGIEQWRRRLGAHARRLRRDADGLERDGREGLAGRLRGDADACDELLSTVETLAATVIPAGSTWESAAGRALELLDQYLPEQRLDDEAEFEALRTVHTLLGELGGLDVMEGVCTPERFAQAVNDHLQSPWGRTGSFDNGVFAGPVGAARGTSFDLVIILGMVESAFPRTPREDPLLPDHERSRVPGLAGRAAARTRRDREDFLAACAAAPRVIMSFPAADLRGQRKNLPSRWLLDTATELAGERIYTADFERIIEQPAGHDWMLAVPSFQSGLLSAGLPPGTSHEFALRELLAAGSTVESAPPVLDDPALAQGLRSTRARVSTAFTEWDGNAAGTGTFSIIDGAATSPTRLEAWAACGFRYFLASVLRVEPTPEPGDELSISALNRGALVHDVLETFFRERGPGKEPGDPWTADDRARLQEIALQACQDAEADGVTGRSLMWRLEKDLLLRDLDALLDVDQARREGLGARFVEAEFAFGNAERAPVTVELPGGAIRFRGRIDRVDRCDDGTLVVYDYKTGSDYGFKDLNDDPLGSGRRLQLPVYSLAANEHLGGEQVEAAYWFVRDGMKDNPRHLPASIAREQLPRVLESIASGIADGVFPARPGPKKWDEWENCKFCDYDRVCPSDRGRRWYRKRDDDALAGYVSLVEGSAAFEEDETE